MSGRNSLRSVGSKEARFLYRRQSDGALRAGIDATVAGIGGRLGRAGEHRLRERLASVIPSNGRDDSLCAFRWHGDAPRRCRGTAVQDCTGPSMRPVGRPRPQEPSVEAAHPTLTRSDRRSCSDISWDPTWLWETLSLSTDERPQRGASGANARTGAWLAVRRRPPSAAACPDPAFVESR